MEGINDELISFINEANAPIKQFCLDYLDEYRRGIRSHPSKQKETNGLALHTVQVIKKALELNQNFDRQEIIETCLVHDLIHWDDAPLNARQVTAILATKGLPWDIYRKKVKYDSTKFVVLILISDMWSAYLNDKDL